MNGTRPPQVQQVTCRHCGTRHTSTCCTTCNTTTPHFAVFRNTRTPSQRVEWDPSAFGGFSADQVELIRKGFMFGLALAYQAEQADRRERADDTEFFGEPHDTQRLEPGVHNCDNWGTGEGQFHGRV